MMTALVVDDEPMVRTVILRFLAPACHELLQAGSAAEGLRVLQSRTTPVDLIITDIVMPGMDGFALAQEVWRGNPDMKILFISGFCDTQALKRNLNRNAAFLLKPFDRTQLLRVIQELGVDGAGETKAAICRVRPPANLRRRAPAKFPVLAKLHARSERIRRRRKEVDGLSSEFRLLCIRWREAERLRLECEGSTCRICSGRAFLRYAT